MRVMRAGIEQKGEFLTLLALNFVVKAMSVTGYNKMDHMDKNF